MRKWMRGILAGLMAVAMICPVASAYNFGDYRSSTLVSKAWEALNDKDLDAVLAYTNKCIELYESKAKEMQAGLEEYPAGDKDEVFAYWALNDVATAYYIQGEAYRQGGMEEEAQEAYQKVVNEFTYGQCWDNGGWFWKPAEAAKEKLAMLESGTEVDFGDYSSSTLTAKAWQALNAGDFDAVKAYVDKTRELYAEKAKEMEASLTEYPWESKEEVFEYWALNDVGTALFILGEAYRKSGEIEEAKEAYQTLIDEYHYAQCWDPQGWFWKPAEAAAEKLAVLED
ncbi:MAG: tetratricopeptide repeat protein [Candidatus Omnitrophota bacterium]